MFFKCNSRCLYPTQDPVCCPVVLTQKYFEFLGTDWLGSVVPTCEPGHRDRPHSRRVMTYTNAQEDLRYVLTLVGEDPSGYSEHSMRRGGATEAARRGAAPDEIQTAGNWASVQTANRYVDHPQMRNQVLQKYLQ